MFSAFSFDRRVLVIDDQQAVHDAYRSVLMPKRRNTQALDAMECELFGGSTLATEQEHEFQVSFAFQGEEGLELVQQACKLGKEFGIAFVDMRMPPGWDGLETIRNLWQVDPGLQVVVCTAYSDHVWRDVCHDLGKIDQLLLLNKPFANEYVLSLAYALTQKRFLMERLHSELATIQQSHKLLEHEIRCRKSAEDSLRRMATCDVLTGLPNRAALIERLRKCLKRQQEETARVNALLFLDLDNFKLINDSMGHSAGDALLTQFAGRLKALERMLKQGSQWSLYRLGGDEFVVLLRSLENASQAEAIAAEIINSAQTPFDIPGCGATVSTSIGISVITHATNDPEEIIRNADTAMYRAKHAGKNRYAVFNEEMHREVLNRLHLETELRLAIANERFELHYQPIINLQTRQTAGFEALVRWVDNSGKLIPPSDFISTAEDTGLIVPLGRWIFRKACEEFGQWKRRFPDSDGCTISINVSKRQLVELDFVQQALNDIEDAGLRARDVNIEVTESTIMQSPAAVREHLNGLDKFGVRIHMDDFGTGHSSLSCLHQFPISVLKIDRSFVTAIDGDNEYTATIEAIVALARNRNIVVTAEGIETRSQFDCLLRLGCDLGQGYLFARPLPAAIALHSRTINWEHDQPATLGSIVPESKVRLLS